MSTQSRMLLRLFQFIIENIQYLICSKSRKISWSFCKDI